MEKKNTNPLGVDYSQNPEDFAKLALGKDPVEVKTPEIIAEESKAKGSAAEESQVKLVEQPQDNAELKPADETKPTEEVKVENITPTAETVQDPNKLSPEEYQKREAAKIIQRQGEERKRAMLAHIEATKANPEHIHTIAKYDNKLANEVIKEVWGYADYEEMKKQSKIAELRETDPERAEMEERLLRLETSERTAQTNAKAQVEKTYLASKGVTVNEYDPLYTRVQEKLNLLNPTFVQNNYAEALAEAYRMAHGDDVIDPKKVALQEAINKKDANSVASTNGVKQSPQTPSPYNEAQQGFASLVGAKII